MPITSNEHFLIRNRNLRNELLNQTDRYLFSDAPITEEQKQEMIIYRQKLRDFINENKSKYLMMVKILLNFPKHLNFQI